MSAKKQSQKVLVEILNEVNSIMESIGKNANVDYEDIQEFDFMALRLSNIQRKLDKQINEPATLK
jgi:hypothetical protein